MTKVTSLYVVNEELLNEIDVHLTVKEISVILSVLSDGEIAELIQLLSGWEKIEG